MRTRNLFWTALSLVCGCYHSVDGGPEASETRSVEPFSRIWVDDGLPVTFVAGPPQVAIDAQQRVVAAIETSVKDGRLLVQLKPGILVTGFSSTHITVSGTGVTAFELTGGSKLSAEGLSGDQLSLKASGASTFVLSGSANQARITASGFSTVSAAKLSLGQATVDASGASTVAVHVSQSVDGSASGASKIVVSGGGDFSQVALSGGSTVSF